MRELKNLIIVCALCSLLLPVFAEGAILTLRDGSVYNAIEIGRYDGRDGKFAVNKGEKLVRVRMEEIESIDFNDAVGRLTLLDGSVYSDIAILAFDGIVDRFQIRRGENIVDVRASEIGEVDFERTPLAADLLPEPIGVPVVPQETVPAEISTAEEFDAEPLEKNVTPEEKAMAAEKLKSGAARMPVGDPSEPSEWEIAIDAPVEEAVSTEPTQGKGWGDAALYSNLPEDFGKAKIATQAEGDKLKGYVPRWKDSANKSTSSAKSASKSDDTESRKTRTARSTSRSTRSRSKADASEGASDRALANADTSSRNSSRDDRRSSRSSRSSSRSGRDDRDGGRDGGRGGSRFGSDSWGGNRGNYSGGGGYSGSGGYGRSSYGSSSYGGSSYDSFSDGGYSGDFDSYGY